MKQGCVCRCAFWGHAAPPQRGWGEPELRLGVGLAGFPQLRVALGTKAPARVPGASSCPLPALCQGKTTHTLPTSLGCGDIFQGPCFGARRGSPLEMASACAHLHEPAPPAWGQLCGMLPSHSTICTTPVPPGLDLGSSPALLYPTSQCPKGRNHLSPYRFIVPGLHCWCSQGRRGEGGWK